MGRWAPPAHSHGLIREYIVSPCSSGLCAGECGRLPGLVEQRHALCDKGVVCCRLVNNHPSSGAFGISPSPLSACLLARCRDAQTFGYLSIVSFFSSLQVEYSRSGSKMWASQRALSNLTEIRDLLVNAQYTVRVSVRTRFRCPGGLGTWGDGWPFMRTPCLPL